MHARSFFVGVAASAAAQQVTRRWRLPCSRAASAHAHSKPAKVTIALCQMPVTDDKEQNYAKAEVYVSDSAKKGAHIVVLPEMWNCPYSNDYFPNFAENVDSGASKSFEVMANLARKHGVLLIGGSIPERVGSSVYNTCFIFDVDGHLLGKHRKVHLFDIDIPGKMTFKESDTLTAGPSLTVLDTRFGRIGIGICYDLRFAEMAIGYREQGADIIVYPGAFNMTTGPAHWALLQRARALDNQLFVCTCSPARNPDASYQAWGHSMVVGPYGDVLAELDEVGDTLIQEIEFEQTATVRQNIPLTSQRRNDLYAISLQ